MKRLHFAAIVSGTLVSLMATLVACSSDDTIVTTPDAGDGGQESSTVDSGSDTGTADVNVADVVEEPEPDAGFKPDAAQQSIGSAICETVARCCFGSSLDGGAPVDGGSYDQTKCLDTYLANGFELSNPGANADPNRFTLSQTKAAECVQKVKALTCNLGFAEFQDVRTTCYAAIVGKQALTQPCNVSGECVTGTFCNKTDGGGACEALRTTDGGCGDFTDDPAVAQNACSNRYSGTPGRYCEFYDTVNDDTFPQNQWFCKDSRANGQLCLNSAWCAAGSCNAENNVCGSPVNYFPQAFCDTYKK